jgi:hypothetical protein
VTVRISEDVLAKICARNISLKEVEQCFYNVEFGYCEDTRAHHKTDPITKWFVAPTDKDRLLKIMFVPRENGVDIKSAYEATPNVMRIYRKFANESDQGVVP